MYKVVLLDMAKAPGIKKTDLPAGQMLIFLKKDYMKLKKPDKHLKTKDSILILHILPF